jgi:hypothetical protein
MKSKTVTSSKTSARKLQQHRRVLSRSMAAKIILDLEPQYADTVTARTLRAARVLTTNFAVKRDICDALSTVIVAEQTGHWGSPNDQAPKCVWQACIAIWRLQRDLTTDPPDSRVAKAPRYSTPKASPH